MSKALHRITRYTQAAMERYGIPREHMPTVVIVSETEMNSAWGRYDAVNNVVYYSQWVESEQFTELRASVEYHEMWHMKQAEEFRQKGGVITEENWGEYIQELCGVCKKKLDAAGINEYNVSEISKYAQKNYFNNRFDEVEAEWRANEAIK